MAIQGSFLNNPGNYRLGLSSQNINWLDSNMPSSPLATGGAPAGGGGINWGGIGSGIMSNINPIVTGGSAILGAVGAGLNASAEQKRYEEEKKAQERREKQQQANFNRQMGMDTVKLLKDDFKTALYRSLRGGY